MHGEGLLSPLPLAPSLGSSLSVGASCGLLCFACLAACGFLVAAGVSGSWARLSPLPLFLSLCGTVSWSNNDLDWYSSEPLAVCVSRSDGALSSWVVWGLLWPLGLSAPALVRLVVLCCGCWCVWSVVVVGFLVGLGSSVACGALRLRCVALVPLVLGWVALGGFSAPSVRPFLRVRCVVLLGWCACVVPSRTVLR